MLCHDAVDSFGARQPLRCRDRRRVLFHVQAGRRLGQLQQLLPEVRHLLFLVLEVEVDHVLQRADLDAVAALEIGVQARFELMQENRPLGLGLPEPGEGWDLGVHDLSAGLAESKQGVAKHSVGVLRVARERRAQDPIRRPLSAPRGRGHKQILASARQPKSSIASATHRACGPAVSWLAAIGTIPDRLMLPTAGLKPTTPLTDDGLMIEPSVSVPTATGDNPAETATAEPEEEPDGERSSE